VAVQLLVRPPRNPRAAAWWLAIGLALMFALGPDERFGYFIYPLGLLGWLALTRPARSPLPTKLPRPAPEIPAPEIAAQEIAATE
jgi:hypothetical protein